MSTDEFHTEQDLRDLYYDPKTGYASEEVLYSKAREGGLEVTRGQVGDWLREQDTYTKFKALRKPREYSRVFVEGLGIQLQMDLVDMQKFKAENDDFYWILTAVEVLSRYAFAVPVLRKDTKNMTDAVDEVMDEFGERFGGYPKKVQFDEGKEFYNVGVKEIFDYHKIVHFSTHTAKKASIVERFNRTLKTRMWKYFDAEKTKKWIGVLGEFVDGYNGSKNRTIGMKPKDVDKSNADVVFTTLYGYGDVEIHKPKFAVGDRVRIHKYKNTFAKGFEANFGDELMTVSKVYRGDPNMYGVEDELGRAMAGRFYEREMAAQTVRARPIPKPRRPTPKPRRVEPLTPEPRRPTPKPRTAGPPTAGFAASG